jgi:hypothetical protein
MMEDITVWKKSDQRNTKQATQSIAANMESIKNLIEIKKKLT